ncbi:MAG: hypothetical protein HC913_22385 [Microscillaceae bacterium]|nr:hypothetical protein [Microscillaceae bacterium]
MDVASLSPEAVVNRYLEAIGGREKLEKITTLRRVASAEVSGMQMEVEEINRTPNSTYKKQSMMGQVMFTTVFNGEKSMIISPQGKQILEGEEANALNEGGIFPALMWLNNPEYELSLEGEAEVNGEKAIKLRVKTGNSEGTLYYYSLATGLQLREETKSPQGTTYANITAYEEIEEIKFIKEMQSEQMGMAFKIIYQTTELNPQVDETIFKIE